MNPTKPATIRPDWKRPEPPTQPGKRILTVDNSGDGWLPQWSPADDTGEPSERAFTDEDDTREPIPLVGEEHWPFVEDVVTAEDWTSASFMDVS
jgi:hypothetical protein